MYTTENEKNIGLFLQGQTPAGFAKNITFLGCHNGWIFPPPLFVDVFVGGDMNLAKPVGDFYLTPETPKKLTWPQFLSSKHHLFQLRVASFMKGKR